MLSAKLTTKALIVTSIVVKTTNNIILHDKVKDKNKQKKLMVTSVVVLPKLNVTTHHVC